ncbi:unnamed protein product, partial [Aureobasidium mustum]
MSTFTLPGSSPECPVHLTDDLTKEQLLSFPAFKNWSETLQHSLKQQESKTHTFHQAPYKLRRIDIQSVDFFGGERIGFIKFKAEVSNDNGEKFPGSVFLRGGSVAMLHVILTVQPRIPAGSLCFSELPAGMLDDAGTFSGGAAKEIEEETGLKIKEDELTDLTKLTFSSDEQTQDGEKLQKAMYPSAGGCDEFVPIFLHQQRIPRKQLKDWQGKLTGLRDHGEKITLKVVRLEELFREGGRDSKALAAWSMYEGLRREGKL